MKSSVFFFLLFLLHEVALNAQTLGLQSSLKAHHGGVQNIRFSPNGKWLASCGLNGEVAVWDVAKSKSLFSSKLHDGMVTEVSFAPNGYLLASSGKDGKVHVWDVAKNKLIASWNVSIRSGGVSFVFFSPDNHRVFFGGDGGKLFVAKLSEPGIETIYLDTWKTHTGAYLHGLTGGALAPDNKHVMMSVGFYIVLAPLDSSGVIARSFYYPFEQINDVIAVPKKKQLASWGYDGKVTLWDYASGKIVKRFAVSDRGNYSAAALSPDGQLLATGASSDAFHVWNTSSGDLLASNKSHSELVRVCRFSPIENVLATASYDGQIKLFKVTPPDATITEQTTTINPIKSNQGNAASDTATYFFMNTKIELGKAIRLENIQFEQSKHELKQSSYAELNEVVKMMNKYPNIEIEVGGHTDNVGNPLLNHQLSERRAKAVKTYLVEKGIEPYRIRVVAYGGTVPIGDNNNETTRKLNRRVEMKIIKL